VLRLLARGHDIKSIAGELGISVAAANERLRSARQRLGVSSSREAARTLAAKEGHPTLSVDRKKGVAIATIESQPDRPVLIWIGVIMGVAVAMTIALMALFGSHAGHANAPRVVRTSPSVGAVVPPGALKLSVTFDRPMQTGSYSFVQKDAGTYPDCANNMPKQSADGRTMTLACTVAPDHQYEVWFNSPPYMNFKDAHGTPATPFQLKFRTKSK